MPDLLSGSAENPKQELLPTEESNLEADEKAFEGSEESRDVFLEEAPTTTIKTPERRVEGSVAPVAAPVPAIPKDEVTIEVEKVLEEGLGDVYNSLPESAKPKFKEKGERAATEISDMVRSLKVKFRDALKLVLDWLLTIPNSNKFFLEQEAKIKVDKVMELVEERKEEMNKQV
ncbi:MAG: hypothetical protein WA001_02225 [Patescibacteria group bacterium]